MKECWWSLGRRSCRGKASLERLHRTRLEKRSWRRIRCQASYSIEVFCVETKTLGRFRKAKPIQFSLVTGNILCANFRIVLIASMTCFVWESSRQNLYVDCSASTVVDACKHLPTQSRQMSGQLLSKDTIQEQAITSVDLSGESFSITTVRIGSGSILRELRGKVITLLWRIDQAAKVNGTASEIGRVRPKNTNYISRILWLLRRKQMRVRRGEFTSGA